MPFSHFLGQEHIIVYVQKTLARGMLSHALLFTGPRGTGKKTLALMVAQAVNCEEEKAPCGVCLSCRKTVSLQHPDVRVIAREGTGIKIEQMRRIKQEAALQPYEGSKKVFIIEDAEDMNATAANSLLKILEEPPPYLLFILLSSRPQALLPTIRSRCQAFPFRRVSEEKIAEFLRQENDLLPGEARTFASLAQGSVGRALELMKDKSFEELRERVCGFFSDLGETDEGETFSLAEKMAEEKDVPLFLDLMLLFLRDILLQKRLKNPNMLYYSDFTTNLNRFMHIAETDILKAVRAILYTRKELAVPVNQKLALGVLLLELKEVI